MNSDCLQSTSSCLRLAGLYRIRKSTDTYVRIGALFMRGKCVDSYAAYVGCIIMHISFGHGYQCMKAYKAIKTHLARRF